MSPRGTLSSGEDRVPQSIGARGSWRVVCMPEVHPAEVGLALVEGLADALMSDSAAPTLLLWRSQRALLVTRQDTHARRFREASNEMAAAGWPIVLRRSGGSACPVGPGTVQAAMIEPAVAGTTMHAKYDALAELIHSTLHFFGISSLTGPVAAAYCPGSYDLTVEGKKIAGMSQHWFRNRGGIRCVVTAASVNAEEAPDVLARAVNRFYCECGGPLHCQATSLTSLRLCGADAVMAARDPAPALMNYLAFFAARRGGKFGETIRRPRQLSVPIVLSQKN